MKKISLILPFLLTVFAVFAQSKAKMPVVMAPEFKKGGVVLVPSGFWLAGPVVLKSKVNLHLATDLSFKKHQGDIC